MVRVIEALLIVQTEGWFDRWLIPVNIARLWLAGGRSSVNLARAVRIVWEEEAAEVNHILNEEEAEEADRLDNLRFADWEIGSDSHYHVHSPWGVEDPWSLSD